MNNDMYVIEIDLERIRSIIRMFSYPQIQIFLINETTVFGEPHPSSRRHAENRCSRLGSQRQEARRGHRRQSTSII